MEHAHDLQRSLSRKIKDQISSKSWNLPASEALRPKVPRPAKKWIIAQQLRSGYDRAKEPLCHVGCVIKVPGVGFIQILQGFWKKINWQHLSPGLVPFRGKLLSQTPPASSNAFPRLWGRSNRRPASQSFFNKRFQFRILRSFRSLLPPSQCLPNDFTRVLIPPGSHLCLNKRLQFRGKVHGQFRTAHTLKIVSALVLVNHRTANCRTGRTGRSFADF